MLYQELRKLQAAGQPILVGASGAGWMGSGFVAQMALVPGMEVAVLADPDTKAARAAFLAVGIERDNIIETADPGTATDAIRAGKRVVTGSYTLAAQLEGINVLTDATPSPASGAETAYAAIQNGKDVVLINIEADVTIGRILKKKAAAAGVPAA